DEMRSRFHRLLGPRLFPNDLALLFLWLREPERPIRPPTVREIGDFVAHADTREKGPVTDELRDFLSHARMMNRIGPSIDLANLPPDFIANTKRNFDRLPRDLIERKTGQRWKDARRNLDAMLSKFGPSPNGGITIKQKSIVRVEFEALLCALQNYKAEPAFTADDVLRDFIMAAQKSNLIDKVDRPTRERLRPLLAMFALQSMNRTTVVLKDRWRATLDAGSYRNELAVFASTVVQTHKPGGWTGLRVPIFTTAVPARDYCEDGLEVADYVVWERPIDLSAEGKLVSLR
ncbi:hypothetical protein P7L87_27620, partial [Vibrio parahaemolyticus]|nr:hypothetical protein [Vibrio parahaemolyticus]